VATVIDAQAPQRRVGWKLLLGIVFIPFIFVWFLLRDGYSPTARKWGFGYAGLALVVGMLPTIMGTDAPALRSTPAPLISSESGNASVASNQGNAPAAPPAAKEAETTTPDGPDLEALEKDMRRELIWNPEKFLPVKLKSADAGGFDTVLLVSGAIKNFSHFDVKDPVIRCDVFGHSGTRVGTTRRKFYEALKPDQVKEFRELNMGFVESQWARVRCEVANVTVLELSKPFEVGS